MIKLPVLYSFRRCPYAMRARLALFSAQITCELREIVLREKPQHMLMISPKGTVPVLQRDDGTVLEESLDIVFWALGQNDPEQLRAKTPHDRDEMRLLIEKTDLHFKPLLDRYKYHFHAEQESAIKARDQSIGYLQQLDEMVGTSFLYGEHISVADICILPFIRQFALVDRDWFWSQDFLNVIRWLDAFLVSDRFAAIMPKFPLWKPDSETILFP